MNLTPIQTNTVSSLESIRSMLYLLKKQFAEVNKIESQFFLVDEKTNIIVGEA